MKTIFIPAKSKLEIDETKIIQISKKLPINIAIAYSIQYKEKASHIKTILSKKHKITKFSQVLGCSQLKLDKKTKAILLIGSGRFHAVSLAIETKLPIYILDNNTLNKIMEKDIKDFQKKQKASLLKFLNAEEIGILVSVKPGQQKLAKARELKNKLKKKSYIFLSNNINPSELENFPIIKSWVNTACPRLDMDSRIINISNIN